MKNLNVRALVAAAAIAFAAHANAGGVNGSLGVSGSASQYSGSITGATNNVGTSNSIAAAQTNGYGTSFQSATNTSNGIASAGGSIGKDGVTTTNTQYTSSVSQTAGTVTGNSPITGADGSIMNGSSAFGQSTVNSAANGTFSKGTIGGSLNVSGYSNYNVKGYGF